MFQGGASIERYLSFALYHFCREVKYEEDQLSADKQMFLKQHKKLKQEHELLNQQIQAHKKNEETLNRLHAQGVIDERGNPVGGKKHESMK
jgi:prefoldin subunit 5